MILVLSDKEKLEDEHVTLSLLDKIDGLLGEDAPSIAWLTNRQIREGVIEIIEEAMHVRFNDSLLETKKETVVMKLINLLDYVVFADGNVRVPSMNNRFTTQRVAINRDLEEIKKILIANVTFKSTIRYRGALPKGFETN